MNYQKKLPGVFYTIIFLLTAGIHTNLNAQEPEKKDTGSLFNISLETLLNIDVTTASKKAEKNTDAPGVISTITKEEIKYFGANNLNDVLERATSIQKVGSHMFPYNVSVIRGDLRTHYDNHMLVLINGRPARDGLLGGVNSPIYSGFPVEMIDKIEIIRGPGSVLYGTNAFTGIINIITKSDEMKPSLDVSATAGSFGTVQGALTGSYSKGDFKAKLGAKIDNINGWKYSAMTVRPGFGDTLVNMKYGKRNTGLAADLSYKGLSFFGFYTYDNQDNLGILPYTTYAGKNKISRLLLNLGYIHKFNDSWEASLNITHDESDMILDDEALVPFDHHSNADYLAEITINGELTKNLNLVLGGVVNS